MFSRDTFNYEQYISDVYGATDEDIGEGLTDSQREFIYKDAVVGTRNELEKSFENISDRTQRRRLATNEVLEQFDSAREIFGIPEAVEDPEPELTAEAMINYFESIDTGGVLGSRKLSDLTDKYADRFTEGEAAYYQYEQFRGDDTITSKDYNKSIVNKLNSQLESGEGLSGDITLSEAIQQIRQPVAAQQSAEAAESGVIENIARGVGSGLLDLGGKAIEGITTLGDTLALKAGVGDLRFFTEEDNGDFALFRYFPAEEFEKRIEEAGGPGTGILADIGEGVQEIAKFTADGADQNSLSFKAGQVTGQLAGFIGTTVVSGGAGGLALGVTSGTEFQMDDYEQTLLARGETFDLDQQENVALLGGAIGTLESIPAFKALKRLSGVSGPPQIMKWLDTNSGGALTRLLKTTTAGAVEEGLQEVVSQAAQNFVASDIVAYDEERNLFKGAQEAGATGAAAGGVLNALLGIVSGGRRNRSTIEQAEQNPQQTDERVEPTLDNENQAEAQPIGTGDRQEPTIEQPAPRAIVQTPDNKFATPVNGRLVVAETEADLGNQLNSLQVIGDPVEFGESGAAVEQTGTVSSVKSGDQTLIEYDGVQSTGKLERIIEAHDNPENQFRIRAGTTVRDQGKGSIASLGAIRAKGKDGLDAITALNAKIDSGAKPFRVSTTDIENAPQPVTIQIAQPQGRTVKNSSGFRAPKFVGFPNKKPDEEADAFKIRKVKYASDLLGGDFTVSTVTPNVIKASKDGLNYEINISRKTTDGSGKRKNVRGNALTANVIVTDKQGKLVEDATTQNVPLTNEKGELINSSIQIAQPQVGFRIFRETAGGQQTQPLLDAANIEAAANRSGGVVEIAEPDFASVRYGDESISIIISDGQANVFTSDNTVRVVRGNEFIVNNNVDSASVITKQLTQAGYTPGTVRGNRTTFTNTEGRKLTVEDDGFSAKVLEGKQEVLFDELQAELQSTQPQVVQDAQPIEGTQGQVAPAPQPLAAVSNVNARIQATLDRVEVIEGRPTLVNPDGSRTVYEVSEEQLPDLLFDMETSKSAHQNTNLTDEADNTRLLSEKQDWSVDDLRQMIDKVFHPKIAQSIKLHENPNPAVFQTTANSRVVGFFAPNSDGSGNYIHIDASKQRGSLHEVLDTISEEVSHFGFDSFALPQFTKLYDNLFEIVKPQIMQSDNLRLYMQNMTDPNNPKPNEKHMLVNEYFSKLGISLQGFESNKVQLPDGMTREEFENIKSAVIGSRVDDVAIDLSKDVTPDMKEEAQALVRNIIRLQTAAVRGAFKVEFDTIREDGTPGTVRVRSTPYGRATKFIPETENAKRIQKILDIERGNGRYGQMNGFKRKGLEIMNRYNFLNPRMGRENMININDNFSNETRVVNENLREQNVIRSSLNSAMKEYRIPELQAGDSYVDALTKAGVPANHKPFGIRKKTSLEVAADLDAMLLEGTQSKYDNSALIQEQFREIKSQLRTWAQADETGALAAKLPERLRQLDNEQVKYTADWTKRRYDSDTPLGLRRLNIMLKELETDVQLVQDGDYLNTLDNRANDAQARIDEIQSGSAALNKSEVAELDQLQETVTVSNRMNALYRYAVSVSQSQGNQETVQGLMRARIQKSIERNKQNRRFGSGKLNEIDSSKSRSLDPEGNANDALLAEFLGPLNDPFESMVFDLEQQGQILSALRTSSRLAVDLVNDGIARPLGTTGGDFTPSSRGQLLADGQRNTMLEFIEVEAGFVPDIQAQLEMNKTIEFNAVNNIISEFKRNLTVRSGFGITSSYLGNLSMMVSSGHIFNMEQVRNAPPNIRDAWRLRFNAGLDNKKLGNKIVAEMTEANLLGTGVATATVELNQSNAIQAIASAVNEHVSTDKAQRFADGLQRFDDRLAKVFSFSDDYSKVVPYMVNRQLGVLEAEQVVNRSDFPAKGELETDADSVGGKQYQAAIDDFAKRFAAERTRRETVNWELAPTFFRKIAQSPFRIITPDFVGHMVQMTRILAENHVMIVQDLQKAKQYRNEGKEQLASQYRSAAIKRAIGTGINDTLVVGASTGTSAFMADFVNAMWSAVDTEDDENAKLDDRRDYSRDGEWDSAKGMARIYSSITGQVYDAAPYREGQKATMMNYVRANASLSFAQDGPIAGFNGDKPLAETGDIIKKFIGNFIASKDNTIVNGIYQSVILRRDKFGNPTTNKDVVNTFARLLTPQMVQQINQVATGERMFSGSKVNQMYALATNATGVKMLEVPYPRIMNGYGNQLAQFKSSRGSADVRGLNQKISSGDLLSEETIKQLVTSYKSGTNEKFNEAMEAVGYMRGVGYNSDQIIRHLTTDPSTAQSRGLGKGDASLLVNDGKNFFDDAMLRGLKNQRKKWEKALKSDRIEDRLDKQQVENNLENVKRMIGEYSQ